MRKKLVAGNWKMHGSHSANAELLQGILAARPFGCDVAVCVPFPYLSEAAVALAGSDLRWGAQDCSPHDKGAFTGEVSASMLAEFGCRYVIVGHSERRAYHGESDQVVAYKAKAVLARGLTPIVCVGETLGQREQGTAQATVKRQLSAVIHALGHCVGEMVVAYEPVWAIGTGVVATPAQAQEAHKKLREWIATKVSGDVAQKVRIIYGGSVNGGNCNELIALHDVDGFLVGGASLKPEFVSIIQSAQ